MLTLEQLIQDISSVREAVNALEVKGNQNAALVCYSYNKCDEMIKGLQDSIDEIRKQQNQNGSNANTDPGVSPEIILTEVGEEIGN